MTFIHRRFGRGLALKAILMTGAIVLVELWPAGAAVAQQMLDISVAGSAPAVKVVNLPMPARGPVVLTLKGKLHWQNTLEKASGIVTYRWGVMDAGVEFVEGSSETALRAQLGPTGSEATIVNVGRSVTFTPSADPTGRPKDLWIGVRVDECIFQPPNPKLVATCIFNGTVTLTLAR